MISRLDKQKIILSVLLPYIGHVELSAHVLDEKHLERTYEFIIKCPPRGKPIVAVTRGKYDGDLNITYFFPESGVHASVVRKRNGREYLFAFYPINRKIAFICFGNNIPDAISALFINNNNNDTPVEQSSGK